MPDEVFVNISDNHHLYKRALEGELRLADDTAQIALDQLPLAEKLELQNAERFADDVARKTMLNRTSGKSYNNLGELETLEPERDYLSAKAKIKLRVLKKYKEDEKRKLEIEEYYQQIMAERKARGEESAPMPNLNKKRTKHKLVKKRISFCDALMKNKDAQKS